jgi:hypothetical protein
MDPADPSPCVSGRRPHPISALPSRQRQARASVKGSTTSSEPAGAAAEALVAADLFASVLSWRDLGHSETPVVALERPLPGIARCVIAPVPLLWLPVSDRPARHRSRRVRCLAVDDAGNLAAPEAVFTGDAEALLAGIRHHLFRSARSLPADGDSTPRLDTVAALRDPANWGLWARGGPDQPLAVAWQWAMQVQQSRERADARLSPGSVLHLVRQLGRRLQWCVDWVIGGLPRRIGTAMLERPDLGHGLARHLLLLAHGHGGAAPRHVEQALRCEALPTLRWAVKDAGLAQTLFAGRSMPRELCRVAGVGASAIRHVARQARCIPDLSPPRWRDLLTVLDRLPAQRRPLGSSQWGRLAALAGVVARSTDPCDPNARTVAIEALLAGARRMALGNGIERGEDRGWQGVLLEDDSAEELARLVCALNHEASGDGPLAALRRITVAADPERAGSGGDLASRLVDALGRGSAEEFGGLWLALLPPVPSMRLNGCTLSLLRAMHDVLGLGRALRNCLDGAKAVLTYLVSLRCLVGIVDDRGEPIGMVALLLERSSDDVLLQVSQALGPHNKPLSDDVAAAARQFVGWVAGQPASFEGFMRVGEALGRLGSRAGS